MNEKQKLYVAPVTQVVEVKIETRILDASLGGERQSYGSAIEDTWN